MAVTRIKRLSGDIYIDGNLIPTTNGVQAIGFSVLNQAFVSNVTRGIYADAATALITVGHDLDFSTPVTYPRLVAVATSTKANATYAKVKVGGTIKRIEVYDDA